MTDRERTWSCIVKGPDGELPGGADFPMRQAVRSAYFDLLGVLPTELSSGWGTLSHQDLDRNVMELAHDFALRVQAYARLNREDPLFPGPMEQKANMIATLLDERLKA